MQRILYTSVLTCLVFAGPVVAQVEPGGPEKIATAIKTDEVEMQARRDAVRYLGTVDCSRWPEAEKALIEALLSDRSESVRYEAALALAKGCCCTKLAVKALTDCVTGQSERLEKSDRVKMAAMQALARCVRPAERAETKEKDKKPALAFTEYYQLVNDMPLSDVMNQARKAVAEGQAGIATTGTNSAPRPSSVGQILTHALTGPQTGFKAAAGESSTAQQPTGDSAAAAGERKPFFYDLTKTLKGPPIQGQPATLSASAPRAMPLQAPAIRPTAVPVTVTVNLPTAAQPQAVVAVTEESDQLPLGQLPATIPTQSGTLPLVHLPGAHGSMIPSSIPSVPGTPYLPQ